VEKTDGTRVTIQNPSELPPTQNIAKIFEPYVKATILTPNEYLGNLLKLLNDRRGLQVKMAYINENRVLLEYDIPMNEIVTDFYDRLKSVTKGYASFAMSVWLERGKLVKTWV